jgi:hypothetical protein
MAGFISAYMVSIFMTLHMHELHLELSIIRPVHWDSGSKVTCPSLMLAAMWMWRSSAHRMDREPTLQFVHSSTRLEALLFSSHIFLFY